jgi:hypothetical protein
MAEETKTRTFRTSDELWSAVQDQAAERDISVSQFLRDAVTAFTDKPCDECGECAVCGLEQLTTDTLDSEPTATIYGYGRFSETENPDVQAVIDRAKELLREGAVGVSVATDLNPADLPLNPDDITDETLANAHQRVRHVAIVDTPAFSGAYLDLSEDGTVQGPMVFEGIPTGDGRAIGPVGTFVLDEAELPIPILFDLSEGDHTGTVVGFIDRLERKDGINAHGVAPLTASVGVYPAYLMGEPEPGPMTVSAPDKNGYRRYSGTIMPADVCHKGQSGCSKYKYKGFSLDYFHSGARVPLDDGTFTRVGPLMFGDMHADGQVMDYATALQRTNEDARTVFAMGRTFHHPKGLLFSGVLMPDADVMRVQATAPSVELWPDNRGKLELKTALQVPRPALPVAASLSGGGVQTAESEPVVVEQTMGDHFERLQALEDRMAKVEEATAELFAVHLANTL